VNEIKLRVVDIEGNVLKLYLRIFQQKKAGKYIVLYSKCCLIDHTRCAMNFYYAVIKNKNKCSIVNRRL
jgi:hypothetical protein